MTDGPLRRFFLPRLTRRFCLRLALVAASAYLVFGWFLIPTRIQGVSMEPSWHDGGVTLCWRWRFLFREPRVGDVVTVRLAGTRIMYLKRVVAVAGETVEFRRGVLYVDGKARPEPYASRPCDWELPPRKVDMGNVYVIGDNRSVPMAGHVFGQTPVSRLAGSPLW
jgi:signal peptidase I